LIGVSAAALLFWIVVTPSSAYFLQPDTPTQNYVALAWSQGCWEYVTEKMLSVLLTTALPAFQFFSHTYLGYIAPCLLPGWLAAYHRRWGWGFALSWLSLSTFQATSNWWWLPETIIGPNGQVLGALLLPGALSPFFYYRK